MDLWQGTLILAQPAPQYLVLLVRDPDEFDGPVYDAQTVAEGVKDKYGID